MALRRGGVVLARRTHQVGVQETAAQQRRMCRRRETPARVQRGGEHHRIAATAPLREQVVEQVLRVGLANQRLQPTVQTVHDNERAGGALGTPQVRGAQFLQAETQMRKFLRARERLKGTGVGFQVAVERAVRGQQNNRRADGKRLS